MIERLNFYDVYGYLLPGATLIALLFVPFLATGSDIPSLEWSSALAGVIFGYVVGHLLQILSRTGFKEPPQPSRTLLRSPDGFPVKFRSQLTTLFSEDFGLDVSDDKELDLAFEACRYALQSKDVPSYAEQFQGLYALLRGLVAASVIASANYAGWVICGLSSEPMLRGVLLGEIGLLIWLVKADTPFSFAALAALGAGMIVGDGRVDAVRELLVLLTCGATLPFVAFLFFGAHRRFQGSFARAVYTSYYARRKSPLTKT